STPPTPSGVGWQEGPGERAEMSRMGVCLAFAAAVALAGAGSAQGGAAPLDDGGCMGRAAGRRGCAVSTGSTRARPVREALREGAEGLQAVRQGRGPCEKAEIDDDASYQKTE